MLHIFTGPMFSGKTTQLIKLAESLPDYLLYKPSFDTRYADDAAVTHDGKSHKATAILSVEDIKTDSNHLLFDEVHFLIEPFFSGDFIQFVKEQSEQDKHIYCAGLDMDYLSKPFPITAALIKMADAIWMQTATCAKCGEDNATMTTKIGGSHDQYELGAKDIYEPRCKKCWSEFNAAELEKLKWLASFDDPHIVDGDILKQTVTYANGDVRQVTECWTRVMGYHRPVSEFNRGKKSEFYARKNFTEKKAVG